MSRRDELFEGRIVRTADGSDTLRHELLGELYHSDRGAVGEAEHVYIGAGLEFARTTLLDAERQGLVVFEMGFGTGLNAWLTRGYALREGIQVEYHAIEKYPLAPRVLTGLSYSANEGFLSLHTERVTEDNFCLTRYAEDLLLFDIPATLLGRVDVVYFDAFAPEAQPELWSEGVMLKMYALLRPGGILVTYSAKGMVKQNLRAAGLTVHRLPGALGKRHMIRAVK